jgi:hypothetical protein
MIDAMWFEGQVLFALIYYILLDQKIILHYFDNLFEQ